MGLSAKRQFIALCKKNLWLKRKQKVFTFLEYLGGVSWIIMSAFIAHMMLSNVSPTPATSNFPAVPAAPIPATKAYSDICQISPLETTVCILDLLIFADSLTDWLSFYPKNCYLAIVPTEPPLPNGNTVDDLMNMIGNYTGFHFNTITFNNRTSLLDYYTANYGQIFGGNQYFVTW